MFKKILLKSKTSYKENRQFRSFVEPFFIFSKIIKYLVVIILLLGMGFLSSSIQVRAAALGQSIATLSNVAAGSTANYTIALTTTTTIPNDGKIIIQFPTGFDVSTASFTSWTGFDGGQTLTVNSQIITITRDGLGTPSTAGAKTIVLGNIVNTSTPANNYQVTITTKSAADATLDGPTLSLYFQIFSSHSETAINGVYYLRSEAQTHYQNTGGAGSTYDIGTISKTAPTSREERNCGSWVQFYFDENGTYSQTNEMTNIYYHTWWTADNDQGTLGYKTSGAYGSSTDESFAVNTINSPNKAGGYYLYAGTQNFASPQNIFGNAIYNLTAVFKSTNRFPQIISSSGQSSFVIFNLPDDIDTLGLSQDSNTDQDSDGVTDYDELFTYYTNPYNADTDNDGWNDKFEIDNNLDPVDPEIAPNFEFIKQYNGAAASDLFGTSVSSISDIDGDGKDDVLVGATGADPGGLSGAGSVYIYSSGTGGLIQQYNGVATGDGFGNSISSISDIDGDGKDDVLVGAPNADPGGLSGAGSAYIYSSGTGGLIKQFNGAAANSNLGDSVSSISDVDGDGKDDIIVGAPGASPGGVSYAGSVYIYSSDTGNLIQQFNGGAAHNLFGNAVSSISDIDGDGKDDVIVGDSAASPGGLYSAGSAYIYSSGTGNLIQQYNGGAMLNMFGYSVSSISDIDGDGKDDVLVGAYATSPGGISYAGSAYIYSSGTGNLIQQYNGGVMYDSFGYSVSSIADMDDDEKDDVLVGATGADPDSLSGAGSVYVYSSSTGNLIQQFNGKAPSDGFGNSVTSIADIDGDGKDDVLVGASSADSGGIINTGSVYIYSFSDSIPTQSWAKDSVKTNAFDLDNYFKDLNNSTILARNQIVTYSASTADNEYIDVSIDANNQVSFSQPAGWVGTESVTFTATDSTNLSSMSTLVTLNVLGTATALVLDIFPQIGTTTAPVLDILPQTGADLLNNYFSIF